MRVLKRLGGFRRVWERLGEFGRDWESLEELRRNLDSLREFAREFIVAVLIKKCLYDTRNNFFRTVN